MSPARLLVRAIVVTDGRAGHLPAVLDSIAQQTVEPDSLHIVVTGGDDPDIPGALRAQVTRVDAATYSDAVATVLTDHPALPREYLWLLHDDTAPLPPVLASLSATARKRRKAAVIGGAHVRWDDASRLVNLGTTTSRIGARRVTLVEEDDVNQGQYDSRDDVLAVSLAGGLVRRDVWEDFNGLDPGYRGFGDSLDFCRRAWRAGHDVVIVPRARIRHSQERLYGRRDGHDAGRVSTFAQRRTSEWYHALAWTRFWAIGLLIAWAFLAAPLRALTRIAQNEPRLILAELSVPWRLLGRLPRVPLTRAAIAKSSVVPASVVKPLLASSREVIAHVRLTEMGAYERWRVTSAPSDVVRAELARLRTRRRVGLAVTAALAVAASVALFGTWALAMMRGRMLTGDALGVTDLTFVDVWQRSWTGWTEQGFGAPALDGAWASLLAPLAALPGGLRVGIGVLLALAPLWAALAAWGAAGAVSRSTVVRALAALAYGLWPAYLAATSDGRVGAVVAHIALPLVALGVVRAAGWQRGEPIGGDAEHPAVRLGSPSAALGAGVALAVVTTAAPVVLVPAVVAMIVVGAFAGRYRWRMWVVPVPAVVLAGPAVVAAWTAGPWSLASWRILARENGPALVSEPASPWLLLTGVSDRPDGFGPLSASGALALTAALGAVLLACALLALASGRAVIATRVGLVLAAVGVGVAAAAQHTIVVAADGAGQVEANGSPAPGTSLVALGLLGAAAAASARVWDVGEGRSRAWRRTFSALGIGVVSLVLVTHVVGEAWPGRPSGDVDVAGVDVLPLVATLEQQGDAQARVLVIEEREDALSYSVLTGDGTIVVTGRAQRTADGVAVAAGGPGPTPAELSDAVAVLAGAGAGASADLAAWGIGVVVAAPGSAQVADALGEVAELSLMGASDLGTSYRISRPDQVAPVSRAWVEAAGGAIPLAMDGDDASVAIGEDVAGTVLVAAAADDGWVATLDGVQLTRADDPRGRAAFELPAGGGDLEVTYERAGYRWWWWAGALVTLWAIIGSVPLHGRRFREATR